MSANRPEYHLRRVFSDGSSGPLEILPLAAFPEQANLSRRGFVGAGLALGAVLAALDAEAQQPAATPDSPLGGAEESGQLKAHLGAVRALAFTPDGSALVSASADKTVKYWSLAEGMLLKTLAGHAAGVNCVALVAEGRFVFSASDDRTVRLWSLADGEQRAVLARHKGAVYAATVTPDGSLLLSASADRTIRLWSMADGKLLGTLAGHKGAVKSLAVVPNGQGLVSAAADGTIKLWSLAKRRSLGELPGLDNQANALALANDGKWLAAGCADAAVRLYQLSDRTLLETLDAHDGAIHALCLLPESGKLASAGADRAVRIWSLPAGPDEDELLGHEAPIRSLAADAGGRWLASGDEAGTIILWDLQSRQMQGCLFDPNCNRMDGLRYRVRDERSGQVRVFTLPCGSPIPAGATCICNCVPGTFQVGEVAVAQPAPKSRRKPKGDPGMVADRAAERALRRKQRLESDPFDGWGGGLGGGYGGGSYCTCNTICTCIPVCQAHRLLDADPVTKVLAEELLLLMGRRELPYMRWAQRHAAPALQRRIGEVMAAVVRGVQSATCRWPAMSECLARLHHADEVTAIMAAQMAQLRALILGEAPGRPSLARMKTLLDEARRRPWHVRYRQSGRQL